MALIFASDFLSSCSYFNLLEPKNSAISRNDFLNVKLPPRLKSFCRFQDYRVRRREERHERRHRYQWTCKRSSSWEHRSDLNIQPAKSNCQPNEVSDKDTDRSLGQVSESEAKVECEQSVNECISVDVPIRISVKYSHFKRKFDSSDDESSDDD
jgi:hypothetical protein